MLLLGHRQHEAPLMCSKVRLLLLLLLLLLDLLLLGSRVRVAGRRLGATAAAGLPSGVDEALQKLQECPWLSSC